MKKINEPYFDDPDYIVRLARQLIGSKTFVGLGRLHGLEAPQIFNMLSPDLADKVASMNSATLGKICEYAISEADYNEELSFDWEGLARKTKLSDVRPAFSLELNGRLMLEELAVATIICAACDILREKEYQKWTEAQAESRRIDISNYRIRAYPSAKKQ